MAKATAHCTCRECGIEFVRTKKCYNRKDADDWEGYAQRNYTLCGKCYAKERQKREEEKDAYVDIRMNSVPMFHSSDLPIAIIFGGNTKPIKEKLKELGAHWTKDYPTASFLGEAFGEPNYVYRWVIWCEIYKIDAFLKKIELLGIKINTVPSAMDISMYAQMREAENKRKEEKKSERDKELEELGEIPQWPQSIRDELSSGAKWNRKFYGKAGRWSIYLSGTKIELTDDEKEEIEEIGKKRGEWRTKYNSIISKYNIKE